MAALNCLPAVMASVASAGLPGIVSNLAKGEWRKGLPFDFRASLHLTATMLAARHLRGVGPKRTPGAAP